MCSDSVLHAVHPRAAASTIRVAAASDVATPPDDADLLVVPPHLTLLLLGGPAVDAVPADEQRALVYLLDRLAWTRTGRLLHATVTLASVDGVPSAVFRGGLITLLRALATAAGREVREVREQIVTALEPLVPTLPDAAALRSLLRALREAVGDAETMAATAAPIAADRLADDATAGRETRCHDGAEHLAAQVVRTVATAGPTRHVWQGLAALWPAPVLLPPAELDELVDALTRPSTPGVPEAIALASAIPVAGLVEPQADALRFLTFGALVAAAVLEPGDAALHAHATAVRVGTRGTLLAPLGAALARALRSRPAASATSSRTSSTTPPAEPPQEAPLFYADEAPSATWRTDA